MTALKDRLLKYVLVTESSCWEWQGHRSYQGYGRVQLDRRDQPAHRISFTVFNRKIKKRELVLHRCNNKPCINPDHLYAGSKSDNTLDWIRTGKSNMNKRNSLGRFTELGKE